MRARLRALSEAFWLLPAALVLADAGRDVSNPSDLQGLRRLHARFLRARDCE